MNPKDGPSPDEWRGIHVTRGMRLRLSGMTLSLTGEGTSVDVSVSIDL
jgi:hypothetical protein